MFTASSQLNVTLICGPSDMRKAIDGLSNIVAYDLEKEPCSEQLFVFCGRARDKVKILQWSNNGFWLHYRRLEKGHFQWPGIDDEPLSLHISPRQLNWFMQEKIKTACLIRRCSNIASSVLVGDYRTLTT